MCLLECGALNNDSSVAGPMSRRLSALLLVSLMLLTPLSGCFGGDEEDMIPGADDLIVELGDGLIGGVWQSYVLRQMKTCRSTFHTL